MVQLCIKQHHSWCLYKDWYLLVYIICNQIFIGTVQHERSLAASFSFYRMKADCRFLVFLWGKKRHLNNPETWLFVSSCGSSLRTGTSTNLLSIPISHRTICTIPVCRFLLEMWIEKVREKHEERGVKATHFWKMRPSKINGTALNDVQYRW